MFVRRFALPVTVLVTALLATARADVIVVDPHGGPGAALLHSALDAAQPGDVLLLRDGEYLSAGVIQTSKGVTLIADTGTSIDLPNLVFSGLPDGQVILVRNLRFKPVIEAPALEVVSTDKLVLWVEGCDLRGMDASPGPGGGFAGSQGLLAYGPGSVIVERTRATGGRGADASTGPGGEPLLATAGGAAATFSSCGTVSLGELTAIGGRGGDGSPDPQPPFQGGAGVIGWSVVDLAVQAGQFAGGDDGEANPATSKPGPGLLLSGPGHASVRDATIAAGNVLGLGTPVQPIELMTADPPTTYPAPARLLAIDSPVREFGHASVHATAQPGDLAWLFVSIAPGGLQAPAKQGLWNLGPSQPLLPVLLGPTDPTGSIDIDSALPALPQGTDAIVVFAQLAVVDAHGQLLLGTASSVVWISASY